jgi:hypothetical protein
MDVLSSMFAVWEDTVLSRDFSKKCSCSDGYAENNIYLGGTRRVDIVLELLRNYFKLNLKLNSSPKQLKLFIETKLQPKSFMYSVLSFMQIINKSNT